MTGGDPTSAVFSVPLYGGSSEEWMTELVDLRDRFQGISFLQLDRQRYRPDFAEAASRRQARGFSEDHTDPSACHFLSLTEY